MTIDTTRIATEDDLALERSADSFGNPDRRQVVLPNKADRRRAEMCDGDLLNSSCRLDCEPFAPRFAHERPLYLWFGPVAWEPKPNGSDDCS